MTSESKGMDESYSRLFILYTDVLCNTSKEYAATAAYVVTEEILNHGAVPFLEQAVKKRFYQGKKDIT